VVAGTKQDGGETRHIFNARLPSRQTHFNGAAAWLMCAMKARGKRGGIVGDYQIALVQQIDEPVAPDMADVALRVDGQQSGVRRPLDGTIRGRDHLAPPPATFSSGAPCRGSEEAMASRSSPAAVSGRLSVDGSASGTAS